MTYLALIGWDWLSVLVDPVGPEESWHAIFAAPAHLDLETHSREEEEKEGARALLLTGLFFLLSNPGRGY